MGGTETESVVEWDWDQEDELKVYGFSSKKNKIARFTYTYLPNGSGAGNHLGEGQGHMGTEQGGQSLHNSRVCPYYTCLHYHYFFNVEFLKGLCLGP